MAVVNGKLCGVVMVGDITENEVQQVVAVVKTIDTLKKQLAGLLNEQVASMVINKLGECSLNLQAGSVIAGSDSELQAMHEAGLIFKSSGGSNNRNLGNILTIG